MKKEDFKINRLDYDDCGWYVECVKGKNKNMLLRKDLKFHHGTGHHSGGPWQWGEAPGYYSTKKLAQEYLNKYFDERKTMIRKGDKVLLDDSSYSLTVTSNGLEHRIWTPLRGSCKDTWKVLAVNFELPVGGNNCVGEENDTIIQNTNDKLVVFTNARFLKPAIHTIEIDGKKVEMSHESYKSLKEQLLND